MADPWPVTLAGILMNDEPDSNGVRWRSAGIEGWDAAPVRIIDGDRTGRHGGFSGGRLWSPRLLSLPGRAHCPDMATAFQVREQIVASMPGLDSAELIVHESTPKSLTVEINGTPHVSTPIEASPYRVTFLIPLIAYDPFKRAVTPATVAVPAGATVPHVATGTAAAEIEVTTTTTGTVVLSSEGLTLRTSELPAGTVLTSGPGFTNPERTVVGPGGENLFSATLAPMQWPAIVPGANELVNGGTASLEVTYYPTYA